MEPIGRSVLDPPLSRRMTSCGEAATYNNYDNAVARMEPLRNPGPPARPLPDCAAGSARTRRPTGSIRATLSRVDDDVLLQHLEHRGGVLLAQPHRHRLRIDRLRQRKQRGGATDVGGERSDDGH